jgi:hypothetical protein
MESLIDITFNGKRIAMSTDGENARFSLLYNMVAEIGKYRLVIIRHIYFPIYSGEDDTYFA